MPRRRKRKTANGKIKIITLVSLILATLTVAVIWIGEKQDQELKAKNERFAKVYAEKLTVETDRIDHKYKDKNWLAIGDSITAANKYQDKVKSLSKLKSVTTQATPGILLGLVADNLVVEPNIDLVTVFAGTNDYGLSKVLGKITDDEKMDTFYGNIYKVINKIKTQNAEVEIVFITPLKRGKYSDQPVYPNPNSLGYTLFQYAEAIKTVCYSQNIKVVDLFSNSGINENNLQQYTADNLHPNEEGYALISKVIADELEK